MKYLILLFVTISLLSCKKKAEPEPETVYIAPPPATLTVASFTVDNQNGFMFSAANFRYVEGNVLHDDGGNVKIGSVTLTRNTGYYNYGGQNSYTLTSPIVWQVAGTLPYFPPSTFTVGDVPNMPISPQLDTSFVIHASTGFTITNQPLNCDSIMYILANYKVKRAVGTSTSMVFTSLEATDALNGGGANTICNLTIVGYNVVKKSPKQYTEWRFISKVTNGAVVHIKP
ncbi:MAG: hypothetical protein SFY56_04560 [Bacteroidota bacterium]|nr:hypothetical protein [Bacteroidota bacterium]